MIINGYVSYILRDFFTPFNELINREIMMMLSGIGFHEMSCQPSIKNSGKEAHEVNVLKRFKFRRKHALSRHVVFLARCDEEFS
jgi:hypothetical protein